ncbi:UNKNOWN [Stylonychia lemnae]|uniref:Uncharacterized protein n=1 Tax=Stylonychia lemnae TaxID=5949 RepID=A0A078B068_STYLE|nr:UNKNOWN [Stylonychia lemnae]|eukprot:CDW87879.1 UNKNOWN [Stylonychia lemnae]
MLNLSALISETEDQNKKINFEIAPDRKISFSDKKIYLDQFSYAEPTPQPIKGNVVSILRKENNSQSRVTFSPFQNQGKLRKLPQSEIRNMKNSLIQNKKKQSVPEQHEYEEFLSQTTFTRSDFEKIMEKQLHQTPQTQFILKLFFESINSIIKNNRISQKTTRQPLRSSNTCQKIGD